MDKALEAAARQNVGAVLAIARRCAKKRAQSDVNTPISEPPVQPVAQPAKPPAQHKGVIHKRLRPVKIGRAHV